MYGMQRGAIPKSAKRKWVTADDEGVCESCGPLHGVEIQLGDRFTSDAGRTWSPPLHVNCRCTVELVVDLTEKSKDSLLRVLSQENENLVMKARGDDPYNRKPDGRFSSHESRGPKAQPKKTTERTAPKTQTTETSLDPGVQELLRQHKAQTKAEVDAILD